VVCRSPKPSTRKIKILLKDSAWGGKQFWIILKIILRADLTINEIFKTLAKNIFFRYHVCASAKNHNIYLMLGYTWRTRGVIFATNLLVISIFVGIGYILDRAFDKKAFFIFIMLLFSFPIPTMIIRHLIKRQRATHRSMYSETKGLEKISVKEYLK
jgi:ABC-type multidrug transport system permease subunit